MNPYSKFDLRSFIDNVPTNEIENKNREIIKEIENMYLDFIDKLKRGECFLCGEKINYFDEGKFCLHWFLNTKAIKKKYFEKYLNNQEFEFPRIDSYFRWLAHSEDPIKNISDLREDMSSNAYLESTIKFKNIEWSFSIGNTDLEGHKGAQTGNKPHYHLQMLVDGFPFIRFNDLHILFTDEDLWYMEFFNQNKDRAKLFYPYGSGISILENKKALEMIDQIMTVTDDFENATFNTSTLLEAPDGQLITPEIIERAYQIQRETKKPISQIIKEIDPQIKITKLISHGDGVPEIAKRSGKK
jgi:hypothetical protein